MNAHAVVLFLHSYLRWFVLGFAVLVLVRSAGWRKKTEWSASDERTHKVFVGLVDTQLLLGLLLYFLLSPITRAFFASVGASMKVTELRFFGIEHITVMLVAVVIAHVGRIRSKRKSDPKERHKSVFRMTVATLVFMFAGVPWPFFHAKRPLFRTASGETTEQAPKVATCPPVYTSRCASCHGETGHGDGPLAGSLQPRPRSFSGGWKGEKTEAHARAVIREGGAAYGLSPLMAPNPDLSDAEVQALGTCVLSFGE